MSRPLPRRARRLAALAAFAVSIASFTAFAVGVATALPAAAADIDLGIEATIGLPCFPVDSWGSGSVTVVQKRAGTKLKTVTISPTAGGAACVKPLKGGDVLVISRGSTSRTVTVPRGTMAVDLAANTIRGTVPPAVSQAKLTIQDFTAGYSTGVALAPSVAVASGGFGTDTTGSLDLGRGDRVIATWTDGSDTWHLVRETATAIVQPGSDQLTGTGRPGSAAKVTIKTAKGIVRGVATATIKAQPIASAGFFEASVRKSGKPVLVASGNLVVAKGVTGSFKVPGVAMSVDRAGNSVSATCPRNSDWIVLRDLTKVASGRSATGAIHVSGVDPSGSVALGTRILVGCQVPSGFGAVREIVVE